MPLTTIPHQYLSFTRLAAIHQEKNEADWQADNGTQRPDLLAPAMTVTIADDSQWDPGYVFLTPYQEEQAGPYIYDKRGVRTCKTGCDVERARLTL